MKMSNNNNKLNNVNKSINDIVFKIPQGLIIFLGFSFIFIIVSTLVYLNLKCNAAELAINELHNQAIELNSRNKELLELLDELKNNNSLLQKLVDDLQSENTKLLNKISELQAINEANFDFERISWRAALSSFLITAGLDILFNVF